MKFSFFVEGKNIVRFQLSKARELRAAVEGQDVIRRLEGEAKAGLAEIEEEYFSLKNELERVDKECSTERLQCWKVENQEEQEEVLGTYDIRCKDMMEIREQLLSKLVTLCNHFEEIMEVVDEAKPRLSLDLGFLPKAWLHPSSLSSTYQGLCNQLLVSLQKSLSLPHPRLPAAVASEAANAAAQQSKVLSGLREEWRSMIGELEESLKQKLVESDSVDWVKSGLAPDQQDGRVSLLPPSPSLLPALSSSNTGVSLSPSLRLSAPDLVARPAPEKNHSSFIEATDTKSQVPSTPEAQSQLTRRFPRKITPDQSPLLRQSLIHSTLQRAEKVDNAEHGEDNVAKREASRNHSQDYQEDEGAARKREDGDFSKDSLGVFSPVLSSTLAPHFSSNLSASSSHLSPNYIRYRSFRQNCKFLFSTQELASSI